MALPGDQQVAGFDVAVNHPSGVCRRERLGGLAHKIQGLVRRQRALLPEYLGEGFTDHEFHDEEGPAVPFPVVVDLGDPRVGQACGDTALGPEPLPGRGLRHLRGVEQFHGHKSVEQGVGGFPHGTHTAGADLFLQAVAITQHGPAELSGTATGSRLVGAHYRTTASII